jgi:hypothetical protein
MPPSADYDATLAILRRHTIGAYNGSQVACAAPECRAWMKTDAWHQHVASLVTGAPIPPGGQVEDEQDG